MCNSRVFIKELQRPETYREQIRGSRTETKVVANYLFGLYRAYQLKKFMDSLEFYNPDNDIALNKNQEVIWRK